MADCEKYDASREVQMQDALEFVPHLAAKMNWKGGETILDFGCGLGKITKNILMPTIQSIHPDDGRQFIGVDSSQKMVDFASNNYQCPNICYMSGDILNEDILFPCKFDKVFSFHAIDIIPERKKILQALYKLMKLNGEIGFYIGYSNILPVFEAMRTDPVWAPYHYDAEKYIPAEYYSLDPLADVTRMMASIGFIVDEASAFTRTINFGSMELLADVCMATNPFITRISPKLHENYREQFVNQIPKLRHVSTPEFPLAVQLEYQVFVVRAQKW